MTETQTIGRNEPCPCGSGKKHKRCCGVNAAPKITPPKQTEQSGGPWDPAALANMDPQMMQQVSNALQRLPRGQLQKLQSIMQKAMSGKDVTAESAEFEKSLPPDFQQLMQTFAMSAAMASAQPEPAETEALKSMTEDRAREIVEKAAAEGTITKEQAESLLKGMSAPAAIAQKTALEPVVLPPESAFESATFRPVEATLSASQAESQPEKKEEGSQSKFGKFWRNLGGKPKSESGNPENDHGVGRKDV